jgi:LmbE family N-acetylglucosaminyl deacetylase
VETDRRLLAVVAHPDDETFGAGSVLAWAAGQGAEVTVACGTRGEAGEIAPGSAATPESLGDVREAELRAAAKTLGVARVELLGYRDSGMAGTAENGHPDALINAPQEDVAALVVRVTRSVRPHVVITMEPGGGYGHPDHIRMTEIAVRAFGLAGDAAYSAAGAGPPWRPERLYYFGFKRSLMRAVFEHMRSINPDSDLLRIDTAKMGIPDEDVTTVLDTSPYTATRHAAIAEHRSQGPPPFEMLPDHLYREFFEKDYLVRAEPPWEGGEPETSLFQGL